MVGEVVSLNVTSNFYVYIFFFKIFKWEWDLTKFRNFRVDSGGDGSSLVLLSSENGGQVLGHDERSEVR
jgi:hypothetical protein